MIVVLVLGLVLSEGYVMNKSYDDRGGCDCEKLNDFAEDSSELNEEYCK